MWPSTPAERRRLAIAAPHMLPSTVGTVSASAIFHISWLNPTPYWLAVYASDPPLPSTPATLATGRLARPYPGGSFPRWIALASPSARRLRRNPHACRPSRLAGDVEHLEIRPPIDARACHLEFPAWPTANAPAARSVRGGTKCLRYRKLPPRPARPTPLPPAPTIVNGNVPIQRGINARGGASTSPARLSITHIRPAGISH